MLPERHQRFVRYALVGGMGSLVHWAALGVLVEVAGLGPVVATMIGALLGAIVNYLLNRAYTFRSDAAHRQALPRFMTVAAVGLVLNAVIMQALHGHIHYFAAQAVATAAVLVLGYLLNARWTFGR